MPTRQLRRSRSNRRIASVCGGLATYFGTDPTLVRLIFVLLGLPGGVPGTVALAPGDIRAYAQDQP